MSMRKQLIDEVAELIDAPDGATRLDMAEVAVDKYIKKIADEIYMQMWRDEADSGD